MSTARKIMKLFQKMNRSSKSQTEKYIFIGNGATGVDREILKKYSRLNERKIGPGTKKYSISTRRLKKVHADNFFFWEQADFKGYYAAVKSENKYLWYASDGKWYTLSELMRAEAVDRKLFVTGDVIELYALKKQSVYLFAQWTEKETGRTIHGGYHIFRNSLMAHALGAYQGQCYSNTREALDYAYAQGYRYFEADVAITEDDCLVLSHGWSARACEITGMEYKPEFEHMTRGLFMQQSIGGCHVMDILDLKKFMREHEDTYFEIDSHRVDVTAKMKALLKAFEYDEKLLGRLLIQAESRKIFKEIDKVYRFENYQLILGKEWKKKLEEGISFALDHGVETIAMRHDLWESDMVKLLHGAGFWVMAYTVKDDVEEAKKLLAMGVDTICTDYVNLTDIKSC